MKKYNLVEKNAAKFLSKFPGLKKSIKKFYSVMNYLIYKKSYTYKTALPVEKILSDNSNESFFGYYDKSPVSPDRNHIAFHETNGRHSHLPPDPDKPVSIMIFDTNEKTYKKIGSTTAYNWQQGSRLQWLNESELIYNDSDKGRIVSRIHNINSGAKRSLDIPIYDCFKNSFALCLNFSRLNQLDPDYGYDNQVTSTPIDDLKNDGIYYIDLKTGENKLLITLEHVLSLQPKPNMKDAKHCFNHIMISPDGHNFIFTHRWYRKKVRHEALLLCDINGKKVTVLADNDFVSHCCWINNRTVIGFLRHESYGNSFYRIDTDSGKTELLSEKLKNYGDGHPSVYGNRMLFDSYPDRSRMQHLYIYDMESDEVGNTGSFLSPMKFFGSNRCDLHPRWSPDGKSVCFDCVHEGKREVCMIPLNI